MKISCLFLSLYTVSLRVKLATTTNIKFKFQLSISQNRYGYQFPISPNMQTRIRGQPREAQSWVVFPFSHSTLSRAPFTCTPALQFITRDPQKQSLFVFLHSVSINRSEWYFVLKLTFIGGCYSWGRRSVCSSTALVSRVKLLSQLLCAT